MRDAPAPILFLDFDGVLHPAGPVPGRPVEIRRGQDGRELYLFHHADALAGALDGVEVDLVLSTTWVETFGLQKAAGFLPASLAARVVGATYRRRMDACDWSTWSRWPQIHRYVQQHGLTRWLAIDDDAEGWPDAERHRLIHTSSDHGVNPSELRELVRRLRQL